VIAEAQRGGMAVERHADPAPRLVVDLCAEPG
jgi:hypothetical protein